MQVLQSFHMDSLVDDAKTAARTLYKSQDQAARARTLGLSGSSVPPSLSPSPLAQLQTVRHLPLLVLEVTSCQTSKQASNLEDGID